MVCMRKYTAQNIKGSTVYRPRPSGPRNRYVDSCLCDRATMSRRYLDVNISGQVEGHTWLLGQKNKSGQYQFFLMLSSTYQNFLYYLKENGYIFRGSSSGSFSFVSILKGDLLLNERICSLRSKFFPSKADFIFESLRCQGKQTGSHKSCSPL